MRSDTFHVHTGSRDTVHDITRQCADFVSSYGDGVLHVSAPHATAGLAILETGAGSDDDLLTALSDLLPADDRWRHRHGSPRHRPPHVPPALGPPPPPAPGGAGAAVRLGAGRRRPPRPGHLAEHLPGRPERRQRRARGAAVLPGGLKPARCRPDARRTAALHTRER